MYLLKNTTGSVQNHPQNWRMDCAYRFWTVTLSFCKVYETLQYASWAQDYLPVRSILPVAHVMYLHLHLNRYNVSADFTGCPTHAVPRRSPGTQSSTAAEVCSQRPKSYRRSSARFWNGTASVRPRCSAAPWQGHTRPSQLCAAPLPTVALAGMLSVAASSSSTQPSSEALTS